MAISSALVVLGYYDGGNPDEVPDESIWHHPERLNEWFEACKQRRESGMEPVDSGDETDMTTNEYVREFMEGNKDG